jgi:putative phage-type endonuclease
MSYTILDLEQGSQEWLNARFNYITASQVPVILGLSPYQTPIELFEEKLMKVVNPPPGEKQYIFDMGHKIERMAREWANRELKREFKPMVLVSDKLPELMASLDGFCLESNEILEVKYVGREKLRTISNGDIPYHHGAQIQSQLLVSGAGKCIYFASDGKESITQEILPDYSEFESIAEEVKRFAKRLKDGNAPELTEKDYLIVQDEEFEEIKKVKNQITVLEAQFEEIKTKLLNKYPDNKRVRCNGVSIIRALRKGIVQYKNIPELKGVDVEVYRAKPSIISTVKFEKDVK